MRRLLIPVCLAMFTCAAAPTGAQTTDVPAAPSRGWVDVNFLSLRSSQGGQAYAFADTVFAETRVVAAAYPELPSASGPGVDIGFHLTPRFAAGINLNAVNYEYRVGMAIEVPHPVFLNRHASDADVTANMLERQDRGVDVSLIFIPRTPDAWRVRVFGGPTYFRVKQQMVGLVTYHQQFNLLGFNTVDIQRFEATAEEGSAWGLHAGVDVGYFFSRYVGVGGVVRFNRGTVSVEDPLSGDDADLKAGHTTVGGGLRLRF